jgi:hypothetical protein
LKAEGGEVFRRRFVIVRRPRLLGLALLGGLGFAAGRASRRPSESSAPAQPVSAEESESSQLTGRLQELTDLHATGALTDEEFAAAKAKLLAS